MLNKMSVEFDAISENEAFSRMVVGAFLVPSDPALDDISEVKTAVSEAVTNSIVHGYKGKKGKIFMECCINDRDIFIKISDCGCGIENVVLARKPMYTTKADDERTGMGFTIMEAFMDDVEVISDVGQGTTIKMKRRLS